MSFFGNKLATAEGRNVSLLALFAAIGIEIKADGELPKAEALLAQLNTQKQAAANGAEAALLKAAGVTVAEGQTAALALSGALGARDEQLALYRAGLEAGGVKLGNWITASDLTAEEKKDKTAEQIAAAVKAKNVALIKDAIGTKAGAQAASLIATAGHGHALPTPAGEADTAPETAESLNAAIVAEKDDTKKWALFQKLQALGRAKPTGKN